MLNTGRQPTVIFLESVKDIASDIVENFKGKILSYMINNEGTPNEFYEFLVDIGLYEKYNEPFMKRNYYDKDGLAKLTYKEANPSEDERETLYCMPDDVFCRLESNPYSEELYEKYKEYITTQSYSMSYVEWMESYIYILENQLKTFM